VLALRWQFVLQRAVMRWFFSGIGGAGMNPLAQLLLARGDEVVGSDRGFDQGHNQIVRQLLEQAGATIVPQDGSGIQPGFDRVVHSAAVEMTTPEMVAARALQLQLQPRPALLAELLNASPQGVAIAGSSGKSTVTGMLAWIMRETDRECSIVGGAALAESGAQHMGHCQVGGATAPIIAEACESDGSLVGYYPAIGLITSVTRDHGEIDDLLAQFRPMSQQSQTLVVGADCPVASSLPHQQRLAVGWHEQAHWRLRDRWSDLDGNHAWLEVPDYTESIQLSIPFPGEYQLTNAAYAVCISNLLGVPVRDAVRAVASFPGVARRFQLIGYTAEGGRVIDDYAHNGEKIAAAIAAAQEDAKRLLVLFQPHGFGPARFLRPELRQLWPALLRPQDKLCYPEIYYAGGTVAQDISSKDLAADVRGAAYAADHPAAVAWAAEQAGPDDTILILGARDPRLGDLARAIHTILS
jgi:UDP-N-acetylmuramate--alanine ligase